MQSEKIDLLATALTNLQAKLKPAEKDSSNPFFKSRYSSLEAVWDAIRKPMAEAGLSVAQGGGFTPEGAPTLITTLMHISGQWMSWEYLLTCAKPNDPQALGSATTYARRYCLQAALGVVSEDDDANIAQNRTPQTPRPTQSASYPPRTGFGPA